MKPGHGAGCSCTSCVSRSASERPSLRQIVADGSRIDKLYLGKYIPLREQKLLTKLIKTRAVYDDVRKELLSSSNVSVRGKADLRPKKRGSKHDGTDKSSAQAILQLVDLVDRGKASGSDKDLNECCSCCICQPDGPHAHGGKEHKHYGHEHHEGAHARKKSVGDNRKRAQARKHTRRDTHARHGSRKSMSKTSIVDKNRKAGGTRASRLLRVRAKHVRSVPCTCTFDLKDMIQRKSKAMIKRMKQRPEKAVPAMEYVYGEAYEENTFEKHGAYKAKALVKKSIEKLKDTRLKRGLEAGAKTSLRKLKESNLLDEENKFQMQAEASKSIEKLKTGARKSLEIIKTGTKHSAERIKTGARKSAEKLKSTKNIVKEKIKDVRKSVQPVPISKHSPKEENITKNLEKNAFHIKKDSVTKFREKLKLMEEMEEWACEHECFPEECDPQECIKILMRNRAVRAKAHRARVGSIKENKDKMVSKHQRNVNKSSSSSVNIQTQELMTSARVGATNKEEMLKMKFTEQAKEMKTAVKVGTEKKEGNQMKATEKAKELKTSARVGTGKKEVTQQKNSTDVAKPKISINISTIKKKQRTKNVDTTTGKNKGTKKTKKSRSVKSMTDIALPASKPSKTASMGDVNEKQKKLRKKKRTSTSVVQPYVAQVDTTPRTTASDSSVNRQAVRISSSFSFNIEFYKDKPIKSSETELQQEPENRNTRYKDSGNDIINKKHTGHHTRKTIRRRRTSEARLKTGIKNTQAGGHALKRCFCTLKLKPKKTTVKLTKSAAKGTTAPKNLRGLTRHSTETVQTKTPHRRQKALGLKPYECEPGICVPDECDPYKCDKLIKQRNVKHHAARTNTGRQTKSASSLTKSSGSSRKIQAHTPSNTKEIQRSPQIVHERPLVRSSTPQRQAVRIGSTFSFNIEFYKDTPTNAQRIITASSKDYSGQQKNLEPRKRKQNRGVNRKEPAHFRNRHSQGSTSTLKSKHTATKHSLRRCFCTLKLKPGKRNVKPQSTSKVSITSRSAITQTRKLNEKKVELRNQRHEHVHASYECEPGICIPGECNPYECLKVLNTRQRPHIRRHEKQSNTKQNKTRSAASFTPKSVTPRAKRVQSSVVQYQREVPAREYKGTVNIKKNPRQVKTSPSSPNRQAVRIGSTFSFDIEFFKDRQSPINVTPITYVSPPKKPQNINNKKKDFRDSGSQGDINPNQMSVPVQVEKKQQNARIGAAMKRCFCTLKLNQDKMTKKKKSREMITTGTVTPILKQKIHPTMATKGTKTKKRNRYAHNLKPYECEPYVCTPGECNPYECLERIKRRGHSNEFGTSTDQTKMRSGSSLTQNSSISSGTGTDKTQLRGQNTSTKPFRTRKNATQPSRVKKSIDKVSLRHSHQAVKLGSNFSFDIEFYKNLQPLVEKKVIVRTPHVKTDQKAIKRKKNTGAKAREISKNTQESQVEGGKKKHKAAGIKPALKRCFCTLQLRKKDKRPQNADMNTNVRPPKVYTVSRMTVAETKITSHRQQGEHELGPQRPKYFHHKSKKYIEMERKQLRLGYRTKYNHIVPKFHRVIETNSLRVESSSSQDLQQINSSLSIDTEILKETNHSFQSISNINSLDDNMMNLNNQPLTQNYTGNNKVNEFRGQDLSDVSRLTGRSSYLSRCFCTMNIHTDVTGHKLKPYECEPGVCIPYECDPYECQKLIARRLRIRASKMSGTDAISRSTANYSNLTPSQRAIKLQSNMQKRSVKKTHARNPIVNYKGGPGKSRKQMVRVGSTFSFDIQFSKDRSSPVTREYRNEPKLKYHSNTKSIKTINQRAKGTKSMKMNRDNRDAQSGTTMVNRGSSGSRMLKRCFCTLKLQKRDKQVLQHASHNSTMTSPNTKTVILKAKTTTTAQNTKPYKVRLLDPNECEPNICVPGECNPYECLELIKRRNQKYKTKGLGTASKKYNSVSSLTDSKRIKGQRVQSDSRGRHNRGNSAQIRNTGRGYTQSSKHMSPNKQMVRIGSNFSFNIEFFKDRMPQTNVRDTGKTFHSRQKTHKKKRIHRTSIISTSTVGQHNQKSQAAKKTNVRHMDSQVAQKVRSTVTEISPFLKRCFCTLRLNKIDNKVSKPNKTNTTTKMEAVKTKATEPDKKIVTTEKEKTDNKIAKPTLMNASNSADIEEVKVIFPPKTNSVSSKATFRSRATKKRTAIRKLDPYECEPGVCVPGECDPIVCSERIKRRDMQSKMSGTKTRGRTITSYTSPSAKAKCTQSKCREYKHRPTGNNERYVVEDRRFKSIENPLRQAVRISSSFSFNIEFYKDTVPELAEMSAAPNKNNNKVIIHEETKSRKVRNKSACSQGSCVRNRGSQSQGSKTENRGAGVGPFLKRCFCTLKLQKTGKQPSPNIIDSKSVKTSTPKHYQPNYESMSIGVGTKRKLYNLQPYECAPNICVPGECNPYECLERIQRRNKSTATLTSKYDKCKDTQCYKDPKSRCKNTQCYIKTKQTKVSSANEPKYQTRRRSPTFNRQSVRMGSSFSFDCEFFKDGIRPAFEPSPKEITFNDNNQRHYGINKGAYFQNNRRRENSQMTSIKTKHKSSGMGPLLKRCFCTLKFKKEPFAAGQETKTVNFVSIDVKPQPEAKNKCTPRNPASPYASEPQTIPGQYKPLFQMNLDSKNMTILNRDEIYENITKLYTLQKDNKVGRQTKSSAKNKRPVQPRGKDNLERKTTDNKRHSNQHDCRIDPHKETRNFERTSAHPQYYNTNRQALRMGSSFSFDIELFKDRSPDFASEPMPKEIKPKKYTNIGSSQYVNNKIRNQKSQASCVKTEAKGFGPLLKRCFCTFKLQKNQHVSQKKETKASDCVSLKDKPPPRPKVQIHNKRTSTKTKYVAQNILSLSPYECEPRTCIPGQCDPYECLERIKKRGRSVGTYTKKNHVSSMGTKCTPTCKSKNVQYNFHDKKTVQTETLHSPEPHMIKQPRFQNPLRNGVRYGSNISCSVEFFKEILPPRNDRLHRNHPNYPKTLRESSNRKNAGVSHYGATSKDCQSQSENVKKDEIGVGRRLQRCFCTLKLLNSPPSTNIAPYPKVVAVTRVSVENHLKMSDLYRRSNKSGGSNEMKTILPYIPTKFNKNNSIASFLSYRPHSVSKSRSYRQCHMNDIKILNIPDGKKVKMAKNGEVTNHKKQLTCTQETNRSRSKNKISIKNVIQQLFKKSAKSKTDLITQNLFTSEQAQRTHRFAEIKKDKRRKRVKIQNTDVLKTTKSDRGPSQTNIFTIPKKSKSLKMAIGSEKDKRYKTYIHDIMYQDRKKYSEFQSGDTQQNYMIPTVNYSKKPSSVAHKYYRNKYLCSSCLVLYDKDKNNFRHKENPIFLDEKVVQFSLCSPNKENLQKRKDRKAKNVCYDCGEELCGTDVNVYCPCPKKKVGANLEKKQSQSKKHKIISPKQGILKNCHGDCQANCTTCVHPQKFKKDAKIKVLQNQEQCQEIENSKIKNSHKDKLKPCLKTNFSEAPKIKKTEALIECEKPKKPPEIKKMVCKTKKPCACCGLAPSKKPKSGATPSPRRLNRFFTNVEKCKTACETKSEEDAMMRMMKMFEKCRSKIFGDHPPKPKDVCDYKPMFQVRLDTHSMAILNRDEINEKLTKMKKLKKADRDSVTPEELRLLHGKSCKCCICKKMNNLFTPPQGVSPQKTSKFGRMFGVDKDTCVCGSGPCAVELKKMEAIAADRKLLEERRKHPCVCGTKICETETMKMELKAHGFSKKDKKALRKEQKKRTKDKKKLSEQKKKKAKELKEYLTRQKKYKIEDNLRRKRRRKEEKLMDAQVTKFRNTNAWLLAAESAVDVGQLAGKTATGFLRTLSRLILDPRRTIRQMRDAKHDPRRILTNLKAAWSESGVASTAHRVKRRFGAMSCCERIKEFMEGNAFTNYVYHICDKNPKARLAARKKRLIRRRVPMDFECSLYMASLRKKPWLNVYYKFQWFYPHCVSLLHLLRSVGDVLLFLLAVLVWSPCLLCLECCRTLMCCTLCTG